MLRRKLHESLTVRIFLITLLILLGAGALLRLFEPFYREEQSRNRRTGGSGLGLYLVKMILDRHGARCEIENITDGVRARVIFPTETAS